MALPTLLAPRVRLRPWTLDDIDALHTLWSAPDMRRFLWDDIVITHDTAANAVKSHLETQVQHAIGYWALHIPPPDDSIGGFVGFRFMDQGPDIELMYGLASPHWGKGLASEACTVAIDYLWRSTAFNRLYARTDPSNERSVQVMRRLGMTLESASPAMTTYLLRRSINPTSLEKFLQKLS
jgi:ribosomal-protein-alanine N-acetyltransferase